MAQPTQKANELLEKHGVPKLPIPIEDIARSEGALIARKAFDGTQSGFALRDGETWIIGVNASTSQRRQRFTIAHELGHLVMHEGKLIVDHTMRVNWRDEKSSMATDIEEIEANAFAAAILMPESFIRQRVSTHLRGGPMSRENLISEMAREFDVSVEAMGYRLINLGILVS
ncbi:ImmA/IrrE family metallo-endopeptidase [Streptomyces sp. NBC_00285]|uniref:ImmA/IrrE family metallo-endopeptidase n=1 Tax=Streptomyces sp. NBC_00285 TaxID=2975700 RepID=UPI002E29EEDA|nr:ImmA/IrrE family metallo-endopeptidase [Streptomyces sp. NBC_00285]